MWNKYCKRLHPVVAFSRGASQTWICMMRIRDEVGHEIWWQVKLDNFNFLFDNWTKLGALYFLKD